MFFCKVGYKKKLFMEDNILLTLFNPSIPLSVTGKDHLEANVLLSCIIAEYSTSQLRGNAMDSSINGRRRYLSEPKQSWFGSLP